MGGASQGAASPTARCAATRTRVASFLPRAGVGKGDRVLLASENRPEWGIAYFGILRAGAAAVPVDPELSEAEVVEPRARTRRARGWRSSPTRRRSGCPGLRRRSPSRRARRARGWRSLGEALAGDAAGRAPRRREGAAPDDARLAHLHLRHHRHAQGRDAHPPELRPLVAKLAGAFDLGPGRRAALGAAAAPHLRVLLRAPDAALARRGGRLPRRAHRRPPRRGARDRARHRDDRRAGAVAAAPPADHPGARRQARPRRAGLRGAHERATPRCATRALGWNLGKLLFWPVHRKLGGRMRFLVSGGSALPARSRRPSAASGFNLSEGYGLTEAAPVLAVARPDERRRGAAWARRSPGVELRIDDPDADGVGEVLARGPNVMAGYFAAASAPGVDQELTGQVLEDGWLHTGDLGRLDADGQPHPRRPQEGRHHRRQREERLPRRARGARTATPAHVKELSVVGPARRHAARRSPACACPTTATARATRCARELEEHFRAVSASHARSTQRVKVLHVCRRRAAEDRHPQGEARRWCEELCGSRRAARARRRGRARAARGAAGGDGWLLDLLAEVSRRPRARGHPRRAPRRRPGLRLADAHRARRRAGGGGRARARPPTSSTRSQTVDDLRAARRRRGPAAATAARRRPSSAAGAGRGRRARSAVPGAARRGSGGGCSPPGSGRSTTSSSTRRSPGRPSSRRTGTCWSSPTTPATSTWGW